MEEQALLYREKYYYRPRNNYYNIKLITINSICNNKNACKHDVKLDYSNNTIGNLYLDKQEIYDLLNKCGVPDALIEKHFIVKKNKKRRLFNCFCC